MTINPLFLLATATFGWGFSLAIYRAVAGHFNWPMGALQKRHPLTVLLIGLATLVLTFMFIISDPSRRWPVLVLGLLFALFWTGFLRVASQTALFLAPLAAILMGVLWASTDDGRNEIRAVDDILIERTRRLEQRIEEGLRNALKKAQTPVIDERTAPPTVSPTPGAPPVSLPSTAPGGSAGPVPKKP